jgi:hypothetical protein
VQAPSVPATKGKPISGRTGDTLVLATGGFNTVHADNLRA